MLKGFVLKIIVLDINTGEILHRTHRMNSAYEICDWVIVEQGLFNNSGSENKVLESNGSCV
jgi:ABC-type Na+ transport system ATPase subunit NatA